MKHSRWHTLKIQTPKLMNSLFMWNFKATFHGKWIEFQDFREYHYGDDAKHIDWLASSREGNTVMRRYREEKKWNILVIVDERASLYFWEEKIQLCQDIIELLYNATISSGEAFWGYSLDANGVRYTTPVKDMTALYKLKSFSGKSRKTSTKLSLDFLMKNPIKKSIIFVISDNLNLDEKSFKIAAQKHDIVYIHISSHFENSLQWKGIRQLRFWKYSFNLNLDDTKKVEDYIAWRKQEKQDFSKKLENIWMSSLFLDESSSLMAEFLKFMKQRMIKR